jgi:alkyl hydroperoxide reductase subunit AhpC
MLRGSGALDVFKSIRDDQTWEETMSLRINDTVPDLTVETDQGTFSLHEFIGDSWTILFSHPKDFTPVCTTEFGAVAKLNAE